MVSSFLQYCKWFFLHLPVESGYFIAPLRINGSAIESLFSLLKYGAGGQLSAINYGSGLARIQARTEVARTKCTGDGYRNDAVMPATSNSEHSPAAVPIVSGRSKPCGFSVKEFLFPSLVCQSVFVCVLCVCVCVCGGGGGGGGGGGEMAAMSAPLFQYLLEIVF